MLQSGNSFLVRKTKFEGDSFQSREKQTLTEDVLRERRRRAEKKKKKKNFQSLKNL